MAELPALPATGSLGTGQLDTRDLLVAGVPISISSKYLYLYLALKVLTIELYIIQISWYIAKDFKNWISTKDRHDA